MGKRERERERAAMSSVCVISHTARELDRAHAYMCECAHMWTLVPIVKTFSLRMRTRVCIVRVTDGERRRNVLFGRSRTGGGWGNTHTGNCVHISSHE